MEFLQNTSTDEDEEDEESCVTPPLPPVLAPVAEETLPLCYDHSRREELAGAVALGGRVSGTAGCVWEDYYTLRLRGAFACGKVAAPRDVNALNVSLQL